MPELKDKHENAKWPVLMLPTSCRGRRDFWRETTDGRKGLERFLEIVWTVLTALILDNTALFCPALPCSRPLPVSCPCMGFHTE